MKSIVHKSGTRGHANHGWLDTHHTFSFASYYDPNRIHFGALRVLNDDIVMGGMGFGTHPHDNMEIVSIPLSGALEHRDSMGNNGVIQKGEVQIMSAGTGIQHSEFNHSKTEPVNFLQIWIFPKERNITPRYDQKLFESTERRNRFQTLVSPEKGNGIWINQDAWLSMAEISKENSLTYQVHTPGNGTYLFVINGEVTVGETTLLRRDGLGITEADKIEIKASADSELLVIEVPMMS